MAEFQKLTFRGTLSQEKKEELIEKLKQPGVLSGRPAFGGIGGFIARSYQRGGQVGVELFWFADAGVFVLSGPKSI